MPEIRRTIFAAFARLRGLHQRPATLRKPARACIRTARSGASGFGVLMRNFLTRF